MMSVIDTSFWQGHPDFIQVKSGGNTLVIMKCGGGEGGRLYMDSVYQFNRSAARAVGLNVGCYFFNGPVDPVFAADFQMSVADWRPGDIVALDVENNGNTPHWTPAQAQAWAQRILAHGVPAHLIYVYMSSSVLGAGWWAIVNLGVQLWVAQYGVNDGAPHSQPGSGPWPSYALWQFTSAAVCAGITGLVDTNQFGAGFAGTGSTPITEDDMSATAEAQIAEMHALMVNGTPAHLDVDKFDQGVNAVLDIQARMMAATGGSWDAFDEIVKAVRFLKAAVDPAAMSKAISDKVIASLPTGADATAIGVAVDAALADNFAAIPEATRAAGTVDVATIVAAIAALPALDAAAVLAQLKAKL